MRQPDLKNMAHFTWNFDTGQKENAFILIFKATKSEVSAKLFPSEVFI